METACFWQQRRRDILRAKNRGIASLVVKTAKKTHANEVCIKCALVSFQSVGIGFSRHKKTASVGGLFVLGKKS